MSDLIDSFLDDYFAEAEEHLAVIRRALLVLERTVGQSRHDAANIEELFRSFHSLKGIAVSQGAREAIEGAGGSVEAPVKPAKGAGVQNGKGGAAPGAPAS